MTYVSFGMVNKILKDCQGKTFLEAMDSYSMPVSVWQKFQSIPHPDNGRLKIDTNDKGAITKVTITDAGSGWMVGPEQVYKAAPETKAILGKTATQIIKDDPHVSSTPQVSETDRMWNMVVLAARASRYEE